MKTYTLETLKALQPSDFEEIRASGEQYRHALTSAVIAPLNLPAGWKVNGEYRGEFGGLFPVQCRMTSPDERYQLCLCSPGELSPEWIMILASPDGSYVRIVKTFSLFSPEQISKVVYRAEQCRSLDCSLPGTAAIIVTGVSA